MLNKAQIIGHLGRDPETRYLPSGEAVTGFSIATTEKWKDKNTGEQKEATEWHSINTFGKLAEIAGQHLRKGSLVFVEGKITTRKYTDKDGIERYATSIKADTMKMLGGRDQGEAQQQAPAPTRAPAPRPAAPSGFDDMDSEIPF
jgi:single-strand DNA-binding protein